MCNQCNNASNNWQNWDNFDNRCGFNNESRFGFDPLCEAERIARQARRRRNAENRCACEFIRCMRNCGWD